MELGPTKPNWIHAVKEVTREEAQLLHDLGVEVGCDWSGKDRNGGDKWFEWYDRPHWSRVDLSRLLRRQECPEKLVVFYIRKDEKDGENEAHNS